MSAEAFRPYPIESPRLAKTLRGELERLRNEALASAFDPVDWADFRNKRGVVEGIEIAIAACKRHEEPN